MIDSIPKGPLSVSTDGTAGPYIMVPVARLAELRARLDRHQIEYSVEEDAISLDDEPEIAVVDLGRGADVRAVQAVLDGIRVTGG